MKGSSGQLKIFDTLYGFLQVIITQEKAESDRFLFSKRNFPRLALLESGTRYLGQQGMLSPRNSPFETSDVPLLFLLGWCTFPSSW
jgi:hypothetical protein